MSLGSLLKGEVKQSDDATMSDKSTISPHDVILSDLIQSLESRGFVNKNPQNAGAGEIIQASGTLLLADGSVIKQLAESFGDLSAASGKHKPSAERDQDKAMHHAMKTMQFPSIFQMRCDNSGLEIVGTLKDSGLDEPIPSFNSKHGSEGLSEVNVVGIKEVVGSTHSGETHKPMLAASKLVANVVKGMLFPPDAIRVTPLFIYRRIVGPAS